MNVNARPEGSSFFESVRRFLKNTRQTPEEVLIREPGERIYGAPVHVSAEAQKHWEYALLSQIAYEKAEAIKKSRAEGKGSFGVKPDYSAQSFNPECLLREAGWEFCGDFPGDQLDPKFKAVHLRVEVWTRKEDPAVAVAFAGTVATSLKDWEANLRWFLPAHHDQYSVLVSDLVPAFIAIFQKMYPQTPPVIYSTGHSLGGGLAQQFAYALPDALLQQGQNLPRVIQVYAFDPSPVTGYYSLKKQIRMQNSKGLRTDRIFERGEILAVVRSFLALVRPPSMMNPAVRAVRYNFEGIRDPIYAHNIGRFAEALYLSGVEKPSS
jgi:hypothetical protein